jgi:hypothetical protein
VLKGPPAPGEGAGPTSIGQADGLSSPDIGCRAPLQSEIIADLRFARSVEKTTRSACDGATRLRPDAALGNRTTGRALRYVEPEAAARDRRSICAGSDSFRLAAAVNARLGQPTETQLRRAESAAWGATLDANPARAAERPRMRLVSRKPMAKGSLCGLATVELPIGLKLIDSSS